MNESETRAELIDPALRAAGWGVVEGSRIRREYGITLGALQGNGRRAKPLWADYILEYRNTKLAVIEAKAEDRGVTEGLGQAKDYASRLNLRFAYSTNGRGVYAVDMKTGVEGEISAYPTPEELWAILNPTVNNWRDRFAAVPFEDKGGSHPGRYYQDVAIQEVLNAIAADQQRILLTLATGTGKTFIAFQIAWKLFQSRWNLSREATRRPRILFLADRNILANQAYNAFSAFAEDARVRIAPDEIRKQGQVPTNGNIFFTIFQTFMSGDGEKGYFGEYPADFFDLIIIDECHRGGANDESSWREILEHFSPAVQLGLTATPKRQDNVDTYAYFGDPVYSYSLKEGINDGFLTPFRLKKVSTTIDEYTFTPDDDVLTGEIQPGQTFGESEINRVIEIRERELARVKIFMEQINQNEKTLVFCANQDHALMVRDLINQVKDCRNPDYCHRVTANDGALGETWLKAFADNEKTIPTILTTSQKLSTGVDARNVRNIVLMRPVNSMIEFKQIIGRGTRLYDGKDYFTIYDFVKAHENFQDPEWDGEVQAPPEPYVRPVGEKDTVGSQEPPPYDPDAEPDRPKRIEVRLSDGKVRRIQHMIHTSFWDASGTPLSSQQFLERLFGQLPSFFRSEAELREIWSSPVTRQKLLDRLAEASFGLDQLREMQRVIDAEDSDIYDVLAHVAYALEPEDRAVRASKALAAARSRYSDKEQAFIEFVLAHYVEHGVTELMQDKLKPLLELKYQASVGDALRDLGTAQHVNSVFSGFQAALYG
jgi:type I restriction enzyme R subunit